MLSAAARKRRGQRRGRLFFGRAWRIGVESTDDEMERREKRWRRFGEAELFEKRLVVVLAGPS